MKKNQLSFFAAEIADDLPEKTNISLDTACNFVISEEKTTHSIAMLGVALSVSSLGLLLPNNQQPAAAANFQLQNSNLQSLSPKETRTSFLFSTTQPVHTQHLLAQVVEPSTLIPSVTTPPKLNKKTKNISSLADVVQGELTEKTRSTQTPSHQSGVATTSNSVPTTIYINSDTTQENLPSLPAWNSTSKTTARAHEERIVYTVKPGDTLNKIARRYGISREQLMRANKLINPNLIFVAQRLRIPVTATDNQEKIGSQLASLVQKESPVTKASKSVSIFPQPNSQLESEADNSKNINSQTIAFPNRTVTRRENLAEDPYIARLRADIDKLRQAYRHQSGSNSVGASFPSSDLDRVNPSSKSKSDSNSQNSEQSNFVNQNVIGFSPVAKFSSARSFHSSANKAITPELPPLSSPEKYLPDSPAESFNGYIWPAQGTLTSGYGWRWGRMHKGIDIAAPIGTPIFAAASGKVIFAGWNSGGYGNLVKIKHDNGSVTLYAHNHKLMVRNGQKVEQGQQIAEMGSTGFSTGPHLHFEIRPNGETAVNPIAYLSKR